VTWNINSLRRRLHLLVKLTKEIKPDIVCLQEIKVAPELFPFEEIRELGYAHIALHGQKGYHGVATLARRPFVREQRHFLAGREDARHVAVHFANGLVLDNFYVPAGGDIPDAKLNPKYAHKLLFLEEMASAYAKRRNKKTSKIVLVGDLNVAPLEHDVWSHKQLLDVVSHTPAEVERFLRMQRAHEFVDILRVKRPEPEKVYTWWSYRARDWAASDRGRRLDHILASPAAAPDIAETHILREARDWDSPSDHVPVVAQLRLD
jgi:exodeoxyribonuclease-3